MLLPGSSVRELASPCTGASGEMEDVGGVVGGGGTRGCGGWGGESRACMAACLMEEADAHSEQFINFVRSRVTSAVSVL